MHGLDPGGVAVIDQHHLGRQVFQEAHLLPGQGGAQGGQDVGDPVGLQGDEVQVALHHQGHPGLAQGLGGLGQAVEGAALVIKLGLGRIEVLRLPLADDAATEGQHPGLAVEDGKDDTIAETVVEATAAAGRQQARFLRCLQGKAPILQVAAQAVPFIRGVAQMEGLNDLRGEPPFGQVVSSGLGRRRFSGWLHKNPPPPG